MSDNPCGQSGADRAARSSNGGTMPVAGRVALAVKKGLLRMPSPIKNLVALLGFFLPLGALAYGGGVVGYSNKIPGQNCTACHGVSSGTVPTVVLNGPATLNAGETGSYSLVLTGGPGIKGGMNVAASAGNVVLNAGVGSAKESGELRHASAQAFAGGSASWTFTVTAPTTAGTFTLFGAGNSCNAAGSVGDRSAYVTKVVTVNGVNQPPTVSVAAGAAMTSPTTRALSVGATDDAGEAGLSYTWAATTAPAPVTFSSNGTNAAKNTAASFTRAGDYVFTVTIKDAGNLTVTSTVSVTVSPQVASVAVSPPTSGLAVGRTQQFTAAGMDQFGMAMTPGPTWTWSASGGAINAATGLFTAGATAGGPYTITAAAAGKSGTAQVTVSVGTPPTVAVPAAASANPVTTKTVTLSATGADDGTEAALVYTWSASAPPAPVAFSVNGTNAAKSTVATFSAAGSYALTVTIKDASNLTVMSAVTVAVDSQLQAVVISPSTAVVPPNATRQFTVSAQDQFGVALSPTPAVAWTVPPAAGIISAAGLFRAAATPGGPFTLTASASGKSAAATINVTSGGAPIVAIVPTATPATVMGKSTAVRVLGSDESGEAALVYKWTGTGPGAVTFAQNDSNAAKNTTATFAKAGSYTLMVTLEDAGGMTTTTTVDVVVAQSLSAIAVTPATLTVSPNATQIFAAVALDQFDDAHLGAPAVTWAVTGGGAIDNLGLFTARATNGGPFTVSATSAGIRGTAIVSIGEGGSDTVAPTVALKTADGAVLRGAFTLAVTAADNVAVTEVSYLLDGLQRGVVSGAPFELVLQTRSVANGAHTLQAVAKDAAGNTTRSEGVYVTVSNPAGAERADLVGVMGCSSAGGAPFALVVLLAAVLLGRPRRVR